MSRAKKKKRHTLFRRVFVHGLLLMLSVAIAVGLLFHAFGFGGEPHRVILRLGEELADKIKSPEQLAAQLDALAFLSDRGMAVYTDTGRPLARVGASPPKPLSQKKISALGRQPEFLRVSGQTVGAMRIPKSSGAASAYLVVAWMDHDKGPGFFVALALILLVVGLLSFPLARSITKPLEKLSATARKVGKGDLRARTGITRGDEVGALAETFDAMTAKLGHRIAREKELLADISHEIRTPLARIKVALELCDEIDSTPDALATHLRGIVDDTLELEALLENVLTISRLDASSNEFGHGLRPEIKALTLGDLFEQAKTRFTTAYPGRTLCLLTTHAPPTIHADPALFKRLVDNLLSNAAKYSGDDTDVQLISRTSSNHVIIEVVDQGIGVADGDLKFLFDPFFRTDRSRSREIGGTGLGLTLCKRIVLVHGGTIEAVAGETKGLTIRIHLPLESA